MVAGIFALEVGLMMVVAFSASGPGSRIDAVLSAVCFALCIAALILAIIWARRGAIIADETGLRWRRFGGWKCVGWDEVSDYSGRQYRKSASKTIIAAVIETTAGRIKFGSEWTYSELLLEAVEQRATVAMAREWGLIGTRSCDPWPRVFGYDTFSNRWSPRLLLKLSLMFVVYVLVKPALSLTGLAALVGWRMTLTTAALYLLLTLPLAILLLVRPLLDYRAVQKRLGERVTLTREGLVFEGGTRHIEARWEEVTGYRIVGTGKYTVETGSGAFDFLSSIGNSLLLRENIRLYAIEAADTEWKVRADADALGGEAARWSGGQVGVGARVFHYRTRTVRAWLWYGVLLLVILCGMVAVIFFNSATGSLLDLLPFALIMLALAAVLLKGWQTYRCGGIHLDEDGLMQMTPLGQTRLPWGQISDFYLSKGDAPGGVQRVVEGRDGRRIQFSALIVGDEELKAEIARRAADCGRTE